MILKIKKNLFVVALALLIGVYACGNETDSHDIVEHLYQPEGHTFSFIRGMKGTYEWNMLFDLVYPYNKDLLRSAEALILVVTTTWPHDCFVWEELEKQALVNGYKVHRIYGCDYNEFTDQISENGLGFDYDAARRIFNLPPRHSALVMVAIEK